MGDFCLWQLYIEYRLFESVQSSPENNTMTLKYTNFDVLLLKLFYINPISCKACVVYSKVPHWYPDSVAVAPPMWGRVVSSPARSAAASPGPVRTPGNVWEAARGSAGPSSRSRSLPERGGSCLDGAGRSCPNFGAWRILERKIIEKMSSVTFLDYMSYSQIKFYAIVITKEQLN